VSSGPAAPTVHDVAIVGAGVVGCAIARELSYRDLRVVLLDQGDDVGNGTSKANTAILHTGFDATPGSLESALVRRGAELLREHAARVGIPLEPVGALLVAWDEQQLAALPQLADKAVANGYRHCEIVDAATLYRLEPHLGPGATGALAVPDESIICPWTTALAYATEAVTGGVRLRLGTRVVAVTQGHPHRLATTTGEIRADHLVNAAGLWSDEIDRSLGHATFTVSPRRGELIVFDKLARGLIGRILLPVPTSRGKGVLVAPTVYGNVLLGPTAQDLTDKTDTDSSATGLEFLQENGRRILPDLAQEEVTAVYAGLRAATEHSDYQLRGYPEQRYVCVGGIRSTGLTASMAIAEHVVALLGEAGLDLPTRAAPAPARLPSIGEDGVRAYQSADQIAGDPAYGQIVCHCERVTRGEIRDALTGPVPAADLGGVRRRTRALNGRCQGFYCGAAVRAMLDPAGAALDPAVAIAPAAPRHAPATTTPRGSAAAQRQVREVDVLVVGAGPAGLAAATALARAGAGRVEVLEREQSAGGIPRHSHHTGYGMRDLHRVMSGPGYARHWTDAAAEAGAAVRSGVTATGWAAPLSVETTSPTGLELVGAKAVILATGARERPRSARLVPGSRPEGVLTTGQLQQSVYLEGAHVGRRAVIVGAENVSYSAAMTLRHAGVEVVAMVTDLEHPQSYPPLQLAARLRYGFPVLTRTRVTGLVGRPRLSGVRIRHDDGRTAVVGADTVVFTGDWIPDHELARRAGLDLDPGTRGPSVDTRLGTSLPGVFAAGNLVHPVELADAVAIEGGHAARSVLRWLAGERPRSRTPVVVQGPVRWIAPNTVDPLGPAPASSRFLFWPTQFLARPILRVCQGDRVLHESRMRRTLVPNRAVGLDAGWVPQVDPSAGPVFVVAGA
jgi:glycerol-3-phosphate dehydrogenase